MSSTLSRKRRHTRATFADLVHPNFEELSREYPDFGRAWQVVRQHQKEQGGSLASNVTQEFSMATTRALLHTYFSLCLPQIPTLCPPIPNRHFFVRWITHDLLPLMRRPAYFEPTTTTARTSTTRTRFGIDLGTGATCIYPLLFCAPSVEIEDDHDVMAGNHWKWLATEVDPTSTEMARRNIEANRLLSTKIQVVPVQPTGTQQTRSNPSNDATMDVNDPSKNNRHQLASPSSTEAGPVLRLLEALPLESRPTGVIDIIMTNPPFHDLAAESCHAATQPIRSGDQRVRTRLTENEVSYPGGEVQFLVDFIVDTLQLLPHPFSQQQSTLQQQQQPQPTLTALWQASMFGKKTSWVQIHRILLYMLGPARIQSTEFGPGHLTRWFLAWTFCRPNSRSPLAVYCPKRGNANNIVSNSNSSDGTLLSFPVTLEDPAELSRGLVLALLNRVVACFSSFPGFNLSAQVEVTAKGNLVVVQEATTLVEEWDSNLLPLAILETLQRRQISFMDFLPKEGHFIVDVSVTACNNNATVGTVQLKAYAHSSHGRKVIDKIATHVQADICRTSRRWRRQQQRQEQQQEQPMES